MGYKRQDFAPNTKARAAQMIAIEDGLLDLGQESEANPGCYFRDVDGTAEWINPPMVEDVEYRTIQRWNGKALYTKLINCGLMPANGSVSIELGISASSIQQANLVGHRSNTRAAVFYPNLTCSFSGTSAYVAYNAANTDVTAYLVIYYTKE